MNLAQRKIFWEVVRENLSRTSIVWQGKPLPDQRDALSYTDALVQLAHLTMDLRLLDESVGSDRVIAAWCYNVARVDVDEVGKFLPEVIVFLRNYSKSTITYRAFKRAWSKKYPFVGDFCAPVSNVLSRFLDNPTARDFHLCHQFFSYLTHLNFRFIESDVDGPYEEHETHLQTLQYDPDLIHDLNKIMREWMSDFYIDSDTFWPRFGPGASFETKREEGVLVKYQHLVSTPLQRYVFSHHAGVDLREWAMRDGQSIARSCKLIAVPKNLREKRLISAEPCSNMWLQQAVREALTLYIHKKEHFRAVSCHLLDTVVDLSDQTVSAQMAIQASGTGRYATIDLSAASDTVTWTLVKSLFAGTPLLPYLYATRTPRVVLTQGRTLDMAKYAPMGSALCFPIQVLVFACVVELAIRRMQPVHLSARDVYRVYGDDIIVGTPIYADVCALLGELGFRVNPKKSFSTPIRFRESCGGEGYDGVDVTAMRIPRKFSYEVSGQVHRQASLFELTIDVVNTCYVKGYAALRGYLLDKILQEPSGPVLFAESNPGAVLTMTPTNYRARSRWNDRYQVRQFRVRVATSEPMVMATDLSLEQARYFETLRRYSLPSFVDGCRNSDDMFSPDHRIEVLRSPERLTTKKRWVSDPW